MDRLSYEPLAATHAVELRGALTNPRVYAHLAGSYPTTTSDLAAQFARMASGPPRDRGDQVWWNFAVRLMGGDCIGRIQATIHDRIAEVGYLFGPAYWGRGYAKESLGWLHERLRVSGTVDSIWATVSPKNERSIRLLKSLDYEAVSYQPPEHGNDAPLQLLGYDPGDLVFRHRLSGAEVNT